MKNRKKSLVSVLTLSAALLISGCSSTDTKTNSNAGGAKEEKSELEDKDCCLFTAWKRYFIKIRESV